ncbi:MAG TPA: hypothetical protein VMX79_02370 [bacterium]|nr:hypothetical protein [bacterium]
MRVGPLGSARVKLSPDFTGRKERTADATAPGIANPGEEDTALTPYRATRALAYRVVAAELWFDRFSSRGRGGDPTVRANAKVTVNLRTLDVQTGEVL